MLLLGGRTPFFDNWRVVFPMRWSAMSNLTELLACWLPNCVRASLTGVSKRTTTDVFVHHFVCVVFSSNYAFCVECRLWRNTVVPMRWIGRHFEGSSQGGGGKGNDWKHPMAPMKERSENCRFRLYTIFRAGCVHLDAIYIRRFFLLSFIF